MPFEVSTSECGHDPGGKKVPGGVIQSLGRQSTWSPGAVSVDLGDADGCLDDTVESAALGPRSALPPRAHPADNEPWMAAVEFDRREAEPVEAVRPVSRDNNVGVRQ